MDPGVHIPGMDILGGLANMYLGHGPFSHLFEGFLQKAKPDYKSHHEGLSLLMFNHLLDEHDIIKTQLSHNDQQFIKERIQPPPKYCSSQRDTERPDDKIGGPNGLVTISDENTGGSDDKAFLYQIVANKWNGIDVDKWDYFARDCHHLGITKNLDHTRFLKFTRVLSMEEQNIYNMFYTRTVLHRRAYQHVVWQAIQIMMTDALLKANDHLMIYGKDDQQLKMSECVDDMVAFSKLTDHVYHEILHGVPRVKALGEAANVLCRLEQRKLYRCICQTKPVECSVKVSIEEIRDRVVVLSHESMTADDFEILEVRFDYGMREKNPVESVLFYEKTNPKNNPKKCYVSLMLPANFCERILRFFWKKPGKVPDEVYTAIDDWLKENKVWQKS
ncbi:Deoxynucleoside triphosphate triphosphohydrolase SAMHD1 [Lamellibrachia satsuma]|nr:Deoxynucleoside triphosphate triphosphohydrolase SAMHD1 [Lamellibrachia satsuma]